MSTKLVPPQAFQGLEGMLDMLLNPQKYAQHLNAMKAYLDAINSRLGDLDTKEKADADRQAANTASVAATAAHKKAQEVLEAAHTEAQSLREKAALDTATLRESAHKHYDEAKAYKANLKCLLDEKEMDLARREDELKVARGMAEERLGSAMLLKEEYEAKVARLKSVL